MQKNKNTTTKKKIADAISDLPKVTEVPEVKHLLSCFIIIIYPNRFI